MPLAGQEAAEVEDAAEEAAAPAGTARFFLDDRPIASLGFVLRGDGPRFALAPLAQAFGVEMLVGPLGDSHTLLFDDERVIVGPDSPSFVTISPEGVLREELTRLSSSPMKTPSGLKVPLDFLAKAFGERLGYDLSWDLGAQRLDARRRMLRMLDAEIEVVHQFRVSTVEIRLSERPRWRFERSEGAVDVLFLGDRLQMVEALDVGGDPLIESVDVSEGRIRVALRENATATEPRLVGGTPARLVLDVYRSRRSASADEAAPELDARSERPGIRTIVLDPGHGGSETGAIGRSGTVEKDLALRVARMLASSLQRRMPVRVVLTRDEDVDVPHATRVAIANQNKADLFISLHLNSYFGSAPHGAETYFLSREASDRLAAAAAERENASLSDVERADMADLELILWDLAQSHHLAESQRFANLVQEELNQTLGLRDRGVRQAPFRVLMGADMPAVLVELGFLSNPEEEAKLKSPAYLAELVESLVRAVRRFKVQAEARPSTSSAPSPTAAAPPADPSPAAGGAGVEGRP